MNKGLKQTRTADTVLKDTQKRNTDLMNKGLKLTPCALMPNASFARKETLT